MQIEDLIKRFKVTSIKKDSYQAKCPAHEDSTASLTISKDKKEDKILIYCHAGCRAEQILSAVNLELKDLYNGNKQVKKNTLHEVKRYDYTDENGIKKHCTIRYIDDLGKKTFKQGSYINGKFEFGIKGNKTYLYRLPELIEDISQDREIFIVEGEKDVDNLRQIGVPATTSPMGAGKWRADYNEYFRGATVVIIPDNDNTGRSHAQMIYESIKDIAFSVKILELDVKGKVKGDVSDWLELGNGINDLYSLTANLQTADKMQQTVNKIKDEKEEEKAENERQAIEEFIYTQSDRPRVIHQNVIIKLLEKYQICVTVTANKKRYFLFNDGYWQEKRKDQIAALYFKWLKPIDRTNKLVESITDVLFYMDNVSVSDTIFNSQPNKVNLSNCTFNLDTFKPEPHKPEDYFTYKADYPYIENAKCPIFLQSLRQYSLNSEDWIKAFFEIAGYAMTGTFEIQKMFWFTGSKGRNGKGTCIRVIENLVGDTFTISDIDTREFREKFYKHRFIGKRLATTGDMHNRVANVATLKQLTGGDKQTTDVKFGDAVTFTNNAKMIFAMNQLPQLPPDENIAPIAKRIKILPFEYEIKKPDADVENKIMKELPGIFILAIEGLKRLRKNREFTYVERGDVLLQMYQKNLPVFEQFIIDNIEIDINNKTGLFLYEIWERYQKFMNDIYGGEHWKFDKDQKVRNNWDLGNFIREYFMLRTLKLTSEKKYSAEKGTTAIYFHNLQFINYTGYEEKLTNINNDVENSNYEMYPF